MILPIYIYEGLMDLNDYKDRNETDRKNSFLTRVLNYVEGMKKILRSAFVMGIEIME